MPKATEVQAKIKGETRALNNIMMKIRTVRLRWYGHVLRKEGNDWVKKCMEYEVECARLTGRPKKT